MARLGLRSAKVLDLVNRRGGALPSTLNLLLTVLRAEGWTQVWKGPRYMIARRPW